MNPRSIPVRRKILYSAIVSLIAVTGIMLFLPASARHKLSYMLADAFQRVTRQAYKTKTPPRESIVPVEERIASLEQQLEITLDERSSQQELAVDLAFQKASAKHKEFLELIGMTKDSMVVARGVNLDWVASLPSSVFREGTDGLPYQLRAGRVSHWMKPGSLLDRFAVSIQITPYDDATREFMGIARATSASGRGPEDPRPRRLLHAWRICWRQQYCSTAS